MPYIGKSPDLNASVDTNELADDAVTLGKIGEDVKTAISGSFVAKADKSAITGSFVAKADKSAISGSFVAKADKSAISGSFISKADKSAISGSIVGGVSGSAVSTGSFGRVEIAGALQVDGNLSVTGNYGNSIEMFYPLRPWATTTSFYAHTAKIETGSDPVACSGVAPSGFTGISNMYVMFFPQNSDAVMAMQVSWSIAGDDQTKATHQVSNTAVTECAFEPGDPKANFIFKKSWFNETGSGDFEDTIAAGDVFGIYFAQPSSVDCYMIGVTIVWDF